MKQRIKDQAYQPSSVKYLIMHIKNNDCCKHILGSEEDVIDDAFTFHNKEYAMIQLI